MIYGPGTSTWQVIVPLRWVLMGQTAKWLSGATTV